MGPELQALVQQFEERAWNAGAGEDCLLARCREIGVGLAAVLAEQSDETLALAVQGDYFRRAAVGEEELARLQEFRDFIRREGHRISAEPAALCALMHAEALDSPVRATWLSPAAPTA